MRNLLNFYGTASQFGPQPANTTWEQQAVALQPMVVNLFDGAEKTFQEAQTLSLVGDPKASLAFSKVVDEAPKNPTYLRAALAYFTSGKTSAERSYSEGIRICQLLRELPNLDDRQRLTFVWTQANLYAKRGTNGDWESLKSLFSENNIDPSARNAGEYNILLAVLLLTKEAVTNSERQQNLNEAFKLVENGSTTAELVLGGQVQELLASFQQDEQAKTDLITDARNRFLKAGEATDLATAQVSTIIKFFIDQQDLDNADLYLARLKSMVGAPLVESIPAVGLQSEIMAQRGVDAAEITRIIDEFGTQLASQIRNTSKMNQAKQYQRIANIFDSINLPTQSLKWNEKAVAIEPRFRLALAMENNKLGNKDKAVDICLEAFSDTGDTSYLIALTQILITGEASESHFQKANPVFAKALDNKKFNQGQKINLLLSIANVRIAGEGRTRDAIELYQQAAKLAPGNLLILNNLATAYSETEGELNVAMDYINQALLRHGNRPELIDTKAVILMKMGKLQNALELLTDITNLGSDPRYWWHRAEVEFKLYQKSANADFLKAARKHFQTAQNLQLANQIFTPNEESRLNDLEKKLSAADLPSVNSSSRHFPPNALSIQLSLQAPQQGMQVIL
jgi:Flp pilus assembly protein TadD